MACKTGHISSCLPEAASQRLSFITGFLPGKLYLVLLVLITASWGIEAQVPDPGYYISITQKGGEYNLADYDTILLEREPFQFKVELFAMEGFFLSASFDPYYFHLNDYEKIRDLEYVGGKAMTDTEFNADVELLVSEEGLNYWFYDTDLDWNRFDLGLQVIGDTVRASRSVAQLFDTDERRVIGLNDVDRPLYLFCFRICEMPGTEVREVSDRRRSVVIFKPVK